MYREGQMKPGANDTWIYEPLDELTAMMIELPDKLMQIEENRLSRPSRNATIPGFEWIIDYANHVVEFMASLQAIMTSVSDSNGYRNDQIQEVSHAHVPRRVSC
jgi:hypothetical protein